MVLLTNTLRNFLEKGRSDSGDESSEELSSSGLVPSLSAQKPISPFVSGSSSHSVESSLSSLRTDVHLPRQHLSPYFAAESTYTTSAKATSQSEFTSSD